MDKSVRKALIAASILVLCTAIIGIMIANGTITSARTGGLIDSPIVPASPGNKNYKNVNTNQGMTIYDRIRYWEGGERDPAYTPKEGTDPTLNAANIALGSGVTPQYYQTIPSEYASGRIISDSPNTDHKGVGKEAYCPVDNFDYTYKTNVRNSWSNSVETVIKHANWMQTLTKEKAFCDYKGGLSGHKYTATSAWPDPLNGKYMDLRTDQTKDLRAWVDYYDGAAYLDQFYDMRVYMWGNFQTAIMAYEGYGPSMAAVDSLVTRMGTSMYEFHFYPSGTLKKLQNLVYKGPVPSSDNMKAEGKDSWQKGYNLDYNASYRMAYLQECNGDNCTKDECLKVPDYSQLDNGYPKNYAKSKGKAVTKCYTDNAAYRDEDGNIIYTGVYGYFDDGYQPVADIEKGEQGVTSSYMNAAHFHVVYTAKQYEELLKEAEKSINPLNPSPDKEDPEVKETQGIFKGTIKISPWAAGPFVTILSGGDGKKNADGTINKKIDANVYTEHNSDIWISDPWSETQPNFPDRESKISGTMIYNWFKTNMKDVYCPEPTDGSPIPICNYRWGAQHGVDYDVIHAKNLVKADMWITFTSSYENPFAIAWDWSMCYHSDIQEDTQTVAYVFDGDIESIQDDYPEIYKQMEDFRKEYERTYKQDLEEDPFFESHNVDPKRVYKLFKVARYSDYDPYTVNKSFGENSGIDKDEFAWYNCETMEDDCLIPNDPEHNSGDQVRHGVKYFNGYDFIDYKDGAKDGEYDKIYYGCLSCSLATYFPNTCYSNKNEPDKIKDFNDTTVDRPTGEGSEKEGQYQ